MHTPVKRPRRAALALALSAALVTPVGVGLATAAPGDDVTLTPLGTFSTGAFDEGASEIVAHDPATQRAFVVNAKAGTVDVLDISDPTTPTEVGSLDTPGANSVDVHDGLVVVAEQADDKTDAGSVSFFDAETLEAERTLTVGALPDMVTFTPDGQRVLVANEGEPEGYCDGQVDPVGSISVVDISGGVADARVRTAGFDAFDGRADELRAAGVRLFGPGATVSQDLEPEYIATSADGATAWVTLQEANAVAIVDVAGATVREIVPLGLKDHSVAGQGIDASDKDDEIAVDTHPVKGMYMPDGAVAYTAPAGGEYVVTANEGDAREYDCFAEEERVKDLDLDPTAFPDAEAVQADESLGRLTVTTTSPRGDEGYTELHSFGGRSVSILGADGSQVWDSGDALEQLVAERDPEHFNSGHDDNDSFDSRSDAKGPEPEGLDIGAIGGSSYAFVGLERDSGIAVVDVTDPTGAEIVGYAKNRDFSGDPEAGTAGDLGPEGVHFIPAVDSPTGEPLLLVGNEVSGTTTIWQVDAPGALPEPTLPTDPTEPTDPTHEPTDDATDDSTDEPTSRPTDDGDDTDEPVRGPVVETDLL